MRINSIPLARITPNKVLGLFPGQVFVFPSNRAGIHGAGAARDAYEKFDAVWGQGEGMQGRCYAVPTKDEKILTLPIPEIVPGIERFIDFAIAHPDILFQVSALGCGLAGYTPEQMAPLFLRAIPIKNIALPWVFWQQYPDDTELPA